MFLAAIGARAAYSAPPGTARSGSCRSWRRYALQFTGGDVDEDGTVLAVNCNCFYTEDKGALANPPGALWKIVAADKVPARRRGRSAKKK